MSPPIVLAEPDRPFWGFGEVFLIAALFLPAVFAGSVAVQAASGYLHIDPKLGLPLLTAEFIGYAIVFLALRLLFARHQQPLFESLGWIPQPFRPLHLAVIGIILALVVVVLGNVLGFPNVDTPFDKLLNDALSRIVIAVFGVTLGPVIEELLFRGFLQPVLISSFGVLPGILVTSLVFGGMHLMQNAFLWQSGVLITLVGFVLGVVRHVSGSTRASAITHVAYNVVPFLALIASGGQAGHK
ncbi:MAG TPA: type II CAAX endopeptidase family protein [Bryobacteraceae bacterium]|nr:type II CAAX endopeptidase family protein [Bryobacteraceae bacterium]